jgi:hypothetical protein
MNNITGKECLDCHKIKTLEAFSVNRNKRDGLNLYCRDCNKIRRALSYDKSKEREKAYHYAYVERNRDRIREMSSKRYLIARTNRKQRIVDCLGGKCEICGYQKCLASLEFHHKDPKTKEFCISEAFRRGMYDEDVIIEEARKCLLLCSNCHKELHANEVSQRKQSPQSSS